MHSQQPHKPVTQKDIAQYLGLNQATVSLALRDNPRITLAQRETIQRTAKLLGYTPNASATALAHQKRSSKTQPMQGALAWLNPWPNPEELRVLKEFDLYWQGASETAQQFGFQLEEFTTNDIPMQRMHTIFQARDIRGIIIPPLVPITRPDGWESFPWDKYATVALGQRIKYPEVHFISSDHTANGIMAFENTLKKGYKRIGFIDIYRRRRVFSAGFLWAQQALPENERIPPLYFRDEPADQQLEMLQTWLAKYNPDAINLGINTLLPMLDQLGVSVRENFGLASMSTYDGAVNAGIDQRPKDIGATAIRVLVSALNEQSIGIPSVQNATFIIGKWVNGSMLPDRR